ncbi:unnamed protein product, partial [Brenthis ino]
MSRQKGSCDIASATSFIVGCGCDTTNNKKPSVTNSQQSQCLPNEHCGLKIYQVNIPSSKLGVGCSSGKKRNTEYL